MGCQFLKSWFPPETDTETKITSNQSAGMFPVGKAIMTDIPTNKIFKRQQ